MSHYIVRPADMDDLDALLHLARQTGGGFTNLPADRDELQRRLLLSDTALKTDIKVANGELYILVCVDTKYKKVIGTASIFSKLGTQWPFYSYRSINISQTSQELQKNLQSDVLHLVNDYDGYSEVGGLFLSPEYRGTMAGRLLARSRYLFIAQSRERFAERICADLRGYADEGGRRPFWDGLGRHFFNMEFEDADRYNGLQGNQFIADLMPKYPIYVRLLPEAAQKSIGRPHDDGCGAYKFLMQEGFHYDNCIDIFDGGPTVVANVADLSGIKHSVDATIEIGAGNIPALICAGRACDFRITTAAVSVENGVIHSDASTLKTLSLNPGDKVRYALN